MGAHMFKTNIMLFLFLISLGLCFKSYSANATITKSGTVFTLQNDVLKAEVTYSSGSWMLTKFYNKQTSTEYLTGASRLFFYNYNGTDIYSTDGGWSIGTDTIVDFSFQGTHFGKKLTIPINRTSPNNVSIRLVFKIMDDDGGLFYQNKIKNNESTERTITNADVVDLYLANNLHTLNYVPLITEYTQKMRWESTTGSLAPNTGLNCICVYNSGEGWSIQPEMNNKTDIPSANRTYPDNRLPFAKINAWNNISTVKVSSNTSALQLVLFPGEEYEYIAVDMTVFKGDFLDGRMAVENHLNKRFCYVRNNVYTVMGTNDWDWRGSNPRNGNRNFNYYTQTVIPKAKSANFDYVFVDGDWNTTADYTYSDTCQPEACWGGKLGAITDSVLANNLKFGIWYSLTGGNYVPGWNPHDWGRDLSDPNTISFKKHQIEDTLMAMYHVSHQMVDLPEFFHRTTDTTYSHVSDAVYRKNVNTRNLLNQLAIDHAGYIPKETSEVDETNFESDDFGMFPVRMNGLLHLGYNGYVTQNGGLGTTQNMCMVGFGFMPWGSNYISIDGTTTSMRDLYKMLAARYVKVPNDPANWSSAFNSMAAKFNTWRKNVRMQDVLNDNFKPLTGTDGTGMFAWMHTNSDLTKNYLICVQDPNMSDADNQKWLQLRWLDPAKTYVIVEVTIMGDCSNYYKYVAGPTSGADLMAANKGFFANVSSSAPQSARAFYIYEYTGETQKIIYMDENSYGWSQTVNSDNSLTVNVNAGKPNSTTKLMVYDATANYCFYHDINLNSSGTGSEIYSAGASSGFNNITYEGEDLYSTINATSSEVVTETGASNGKWHKVICSGVDQYVDYAVHVTQPMVCRIKIGFKANTDRGKCKLYINDTQLGPEIDMYNSTSGYYQADLGDYTFQAAGWRHFKLKVTGKNGSSSGYNINCDYIYLQRESPDPTKWYKIVSKADANICLDEFCQRSDSLGVYTYVGSSNQQWKFVKDGNGYYTLINRSTGKAIDIPNSNCTEGTKLIVYTANYGDNQKYQLISTDYGNFRLASKCSSSLSLNALGGASSGNKVGLWGYSGGDNEQWKLVEVQ
jgi:hypothetical protein